MYNVERLIRKILVALDGSEAANKALTFAIDIADKYSAEIVLFTVIQPLTIPYYIPEEMPPIIPEAKTYYDRIEAYYENIVSEARKRVEKEKPQVKVTSKVEEGRPADKIVQFANDEGCDMIIMGSRGLHGIKEVLLGSVSDRVADNASCPVFIVK